MFLFVGPYVISVCSEMGPMSRVLSHRDLKRPTKRLVSQRDVEKVDSTAIHAGRDVNRGIDRFAGARMLARCQIVLSRNHREFEVCSIALRRAVQSWMFRLSRASFDGLKETLRRFGRRAIDRGSKAGERSDRLVV